MVKTDKMDYKKLIKELECSKSGLNQYQISRLNHYRTMLRYEQIDYVMIYFIFLPLILIFLALVFLVIFKNV